MLGFILNQLIWLIVLFSFVYFECRNKISSSYFKFFFLILLNGQDQAMHN